MNPWLLLGGSIGLEVIATNLVKLSDGFTKPLPTIKCVIDLCLIVLFGLHRLPQPACRLGLCRLVRRRDHFDSDGCLLCLWTKTRYARYVRICPDYFRRAGD